MLYKDSVLLKKDTRMIFTSDEDITIDPLTSLQSIKKKIEDLGKEEREHIIKKVNSAKVLWHKAESLKLTAYGIKRKPGRNLGTIVINERASELIEYFGRMMTVNEVIKIIKQDWGYESISKTKLQDFFKTNHKKIKEKQDFYKSSYDCIKLSHKRARLEVLSEIYQVRKGAYNTSKSKSDEIQLLKIIEQIKKEVEVDTLRIEGTLNQKIEITLHDHIQKEALKGLTLNDIIMARVAARIGVNATYLIHKLHTSFYSKFSGMVPTDVSANEVPLYPSQMVYNFDKIKAQNKKLTAEGEELKKNDEVEDIEIIEEKKTFKQIIAERLRERKEELNKTEERIKKNT